jgi:hypothetical protein
MQKIIFLLVFIGLWMSSCRKEEPNVIYPINYYFGTDISQIPDGGTGYVSNVNLSGQGNITNTGNTTVIISGNVTMDALTINHKVVVAEGATLTLNSQLQVSGGAKLIVLGKIVTPVLTQISSLYLNGGEITVTNKYTINGGATLYIQNSVVHVDEMVIIGHIQSIENSFTQNTNVYSVIESIGLKYLNRNGGTNVCGPVLFTVNIDQGSSGVSMSDVTNIVLSAKPNIESIYNLASNSVFYKYNENCTPLTIFPNY